MDKIKNYLVWCSMFLLISCSQFSNLCRHDNLNGRKTGFGNHFSPPVYTELPAGFTGTDDLVTVTPRAEQWLPVNMGYTCRSDL